MMMMMMMMMMKTEEKDIHTTEGIGTRNLSKRAVEDPRLRAFPDNVMLNCKDIQEAVLSSLNA
jgi:hypothetical protein